jgi:hypothetical protein
VKAEVDRLTAELAALDPCRNSGIETFHVPASIAFTGFRSAETLQLVFSRTLHKAVRQMRGNPTQTKTP